MHKASPESPSRLLLTNLQTIWTRFDKSRVISYLLVLHYFNFILTASWWHRQLWRWSQSTLADNLWLSLKAEFHNNDSD